MVLSNKKGDCLIATAFLFDNTETLKKRAKGKKVKKLKGNCPG
jgi:hypothetical protein